MRVSFIPPEHLYKVSYRMKSACLQLCRPVRFFYPHSKRVLLHIRNPVLPKTPNTPGEPLLAGGAKTFKFTEIGIYNFKKGVAVRPYWGYLIIQSAEKLLHPTAGIHD